MHPHFRFTLFAILCSYLELYELSIPSQKGVVFPKNSNNTYTKIVMLYQCYIYSVQFSPNRAYIDNTNIMILYYSTHFTVVYTYNIRMDFFFEWFKDYGTFVLNVFFYKQTFLLHIMRHKVEIEINWSELSLHLILNC